MTQLSIVPATAAYCMAIFVELYQIPVAEVKITINKNFTCFTFTIYN